MANLIIPDSLVNRLLALAEREQRPLEEVLTSMLEKYSSNPSEEEIDARLIAVGGMTPPSHEPLEPPFSEEEQALLERVSSAGLSASEMAIQERKQGY